MKKMLRSYFVFTSTGYRIFVLAVLPLMILSFSALLLGTAGNGIYPEYLLVSYLVVYELLSDFWLFGGICSKDGSSLEYIKTSKRGVNIFRRGIIGDLIRRFLYVTAFAVFFYWRTGLLQDFVIFLIAYIVVVAVLNLTRYLSVFQIHMVVSMGAVIVFGIFAVMSWLAVDILEMSKSEMFIEIGILLLLAVIVSVITVWHMGYRMKGSYYEK